MIPNPSTLDPLLLWPESLPAVAPDDCPEILDVLPPESGPESVKDKNAETD